MITNISKRKVNIVHKLYYSITKNTYRYQLVIEYKTIGIITRNIFICKDAVYSGDTNIFWHLIYRGRL